jgi:hypothetical protein
MVELEATRAVGREAMRRFWQSAFGFFSEGTAWIAWA